MPESFPPRINTAKGPCAQPTEPTIQVTSPIPSSMASPQALARYMDQHQAFTGHLRDLHEEERSLWKTERKQLLERIKELEDTVRALGGSADSSLPSPQQVALYRGVPPLQARPGNAISTGNEFWKGAGGHGHSQPVRAFSEPSNTSDLATARPNHLPAIQEMSPAARKKSVGFDMSQTGSIEKDFHIHPVPTIPVTASGSAFDGVTFKPSALASIGGSHRSSSTQSPSPLYSPYKEPPTIREPQPTVLDLPSSGLSTSDLLVKDAGHTPLARLVDSPLSSSDQNTPKRDEALGVPEPVSVRPPTERSDSYFPASEGGSEPPPTTLKDDPALQEPLSLPNKLEASEDKGFLSVLDSKLRQAQDTDIMSETSEGSEAQNGTNNRTGNANHPGGEDRLASEEPEPKLRIKRSMNFGSVFGASSVGKEA